MTAEKWPVQPFFMEVDFSFDDGFGTKSDLFALVRVAGDTLEVVECDLPQDQDGGDREDLMEQVDEAAAAAAWKLLNLGLAKPLLLPQLDPS